MKSLYSKIKYILWLLSLIVPRIILSQYRFKLPQTETMLGDNDGLIICVLFQNLRPFGKWLKEKKLAYYAQEDNESLASLK